MDPMAMMTTGIMDRKKSAVKEPEFNIATQLANAEYKHTCEFLFFLSSTMVYAAES